jgi:hypothetical protein
MERCATQSKLFANYGAPYTKGSKFDEQLKDLIEYSCPQCILKHKHVGSNIRKWKLSVIVGRKAMMKSTGDMPSTLQTRLDLNFANDYSRNKSAEEGSGVCEEYYGSHLQDD